MNNGGCTEGGYWAYGQFLFWTPEICRGGSWVYVGQVNNVNFPRNGEAWQLSDRSARVFRASTCTGRAVDR